MFIQLRAKLIGLIALGGLLLLGGCAGRLERPNIPKVISESPRNGKVGAYDLEAYKLDMLNYDKATGSDAIRLRNKMIYGVMAEIDYLFYDYETKLFLNEGSFKVGSDFLQLGLSAGSTISNGARGKTVLSALLTGVTGSSLSVDKNFFRQQTVQAISSAMEANRDRIKTIILQQLKQDSINYPFEAAQSDLIKYFFAGTLSAGLQQINQRKPKTI